MSRLVVALVAAFVLVAGGCRTESKASVKTAADVCKLISDRVAQAIFVGPQAGAPQPVTDGTLSCVFTSSKGPVVRLEVLRPDDAGGLTGQAAFDSLVQQRTDALTGQGTADRINGAADAAELFSTSQDRTLLVLGGGHLVQSTSRDATTEQLRFFATEAISSMG